MFCVVGVFVNSLQGIFLLCFWTAYFALTEVGSEHSCSYLLVNIYKFSRLCDKARHWEFIQVWLTMAYDTDYPIILQFTLLAVVVVLENPESPILSSTWFYIVIYLPFLLCVKYFFIVSNVSGVYKASWQLSENTAAVVNNANNGEECAQWGPLTTVKKTGYYDQSFHHCA